MVNPPRIVRRMLASLGILLLLASSSADALGLHRCEHHDQLPSAGTPQHDQHAGHTAPAEKTESHGCTCLGTCSTTTAVAVPTVKHVIDVVATSFVVVTLPPVFVATEPAAFLLPYSTAPPAAL